MNNANKSPPQKPECIPGPNGVRKKTMSRERLNFQNHYISKQQLSLWPTEQKENPASEKLTANQKEKDAKRPRT